MVSTFSVGHLDEIMEYADQSGVDQFITEIAEPRVELDTVGLPITPDKKSYTRAINKLIDHVNNRPYKGISKITEAFRVQYYKLVKRILDEEDQVIPCYAGWASGHIYGDGTVWPCCVRADKLGNLRDHNYDFGAIWFGDKIKEVRRSIAAKECHCPLANASYTNLLHDLPTLARVGTKVMLPALQGKPAAPCQTRSGARLITLSFSSGETLIFALIILRKLPMPFDWLNDFHRAMEKADDYAEKTLAAYSLGIKAGGSISRRQCLRTPKTAAAPPRCCRTASSIFPDECRSALAAADLLRRRQVARASTGPVMTYEEDAV